MTVYYNEIEPYAAEWLRNLIKAGEIPPGDVDERDIRDVTPRELMGYTQCHFFAGIGGWAYALRLAGWPDDRPVWTGSCPCQSFSAAGRGKGGADERHLWPYWFHLIRVCKPPVVFGEQVASKLALSWLDLVCDDLEAEGYAVGTADLCAAGVGAPHIRQRLWFVGHSPGHDKWRSSVSSMHREGVEVGGSGGVDFAVAHPSISRPWNLDRPPTDEGRRAVQPGGESLRQENGAGVADKSGDRCENAGGMADSKVTERRRTGSPLDSRGRVAEIRGPSTSFWSSCEWLPCRDGKFRPTKPGLSPLVTRLSLDMGCLRPGEDSPYRVIKDKEGRSIGQAPWRIGMLRAYGNSIVPEVAAEFIRAYLETIP